MTTTPADLPARILAAIERVEEVARAATPGPWESWIEGRDHFGGDDVILSSGEDIYPRITVDGRYSQNHRADQDHIALHDPAAVLRKCQADKEILADETITFSERQGRGPSILHERILRALASGYGVDLGES